MMRLPWKKHNEAVKQSAEQAKLEYERARADRPRVNAIARGLREPGGRRNGWMEDLTKIMGNQL